MASISTTVCLGLVSGVTFALSQNRPFYAGGPLALNTTTYQFDIEESIPVSSDFDLIHINADSWGVPWDSFIYELPLPFSWENKLNETIAAWRNWDRPLILSLPMGDNDSKRTCPSQNATDSPGGYPSLNPVGNCQQCFNWNTTTSPVAAFFRQGYTNYVLGMIAAFATNAPSQGAVLVGVNFAIDANKVLEVGCGPLWFSAYVEFSNQVYDTVKATFPTVPIFPAFSLESMYGLNAGQQCQGKIDMGAAKPSPALLACFDAGYDALVAMKRDVFGFTAFPSFYTGNTWNTWYITAALDGADQPIDQVNKWLMGTGFISDPVVVNIANSTGSGKQPKPMCQTALTSDAADASAWFDSVIAQSTSYGLQLVVYATARDILFTEAMTSCPCAAPDPYMAPYCNFLNILRQLCNQFGQPSYLCELSPKLQGTSGIRDIVNDVKQPMYDSLQAARAIPPGMTPAESLLLSL